MVVMWTQLDGDNHDPKERLATTDEGTPKSESSPIEHPKVNGRPPSGSSSRISKIKAKKLSPSSTPKSFFRKSKSKTLPSRNSSKRQVVSIKEINFPSPKGVTTGTSTSPVTSDDDCKSSPESSLYNESSQMSPSSDITDNSMKLDSTSSVGTLKSIKITDSLKIKRIIYETPERVKLGRNGSVKMTKTSPNFVLESEDDADLDQTNSPDEGYFSRKKKRFYTLPRNWKSQAVDLFRSKGCFGRKPNSPSEPSYGYEPSNNSPKPNASNDTLNPSSQAAFSSSSQNNYVDTSNNPRGPVPSFQYSASSDPLSQGALSAPSSGGQSAKAPFTTATQHSNSSDPRKTFCEHCKKKCSGEVLRVHDKYFHVACFNCQNCSRSLAQGGFFSRDNKYFCTDCYQDKFGQQCATCGKYVEGEVVSALGNTYHQKCFLCARCRQPFPSGERVTYTGQECLCQKCYHIPTVDSQSPTKSPTSDGPKCAGCKEELVEGQALNALDQQWHIWCFKCASCNALLHGEYMGNDGLPYCEKDYQNQFGVKCAYCERFITGKVLQAGDNRHFHPTCARCTKCGDPFGDGEEMYLQGTAIWHPRCGPGPTENDTVLNGSLSNGHHINGDQKTERDFDGMSSTASETQFSRSRTPSLNGSMRSCSPYNSLNRKCSGPNRTCSPGLILREYKSSQSPIDISRIYTYSFLTAEPTQSYLKKPIDPYDRPPKSPHFHRPPQNDARRLSLPKASSRLGMRVLVDTIQSETPRPKSPKMNNEEPIILSHYPGGKPTKEGQSRIERDDFPAPPYSCTDPDRRRRWSGSSKGSKGLSIDETDDGIVQDDDEIAPIDPKLKKEEVELSKISTGIGKVFLQQVKEREKIRAYKMTHIDPRNASRTPSANKEPGYRMRFDSSVNASPSRLTDHSRPYDEDDFEPGSTYRCSSTGRSSATLPSYNVVSSLRGDPKPGYGLKSSTLPGGIGAQVIGDYHYSGLGEKTHSTDFSSARSDVSACSLTEADRTALNPDICPSATYSSGLRGYSYSPHFRRSLPNMHHMASDPPKIYPAHLLLTNNYRLPNDVDRCHLERHLSDADFELVFHMPRMEFYRLPEWKRNDIKRRTRLF